MKRPQAIFKDPFNEGPNHILVMCDTYDFEGNPLPTNTRFDCNKAMEKAKKVDARPTFGYEQEYQFIDLETGRPLGFPKK